MAGDNFQREGGREEMYSTTVERRGLQLPTQQSKREKDLFFEGREEEEEEKLGCWL